MLRLINLLFALAAVVYSTHCFGQQWITTTINNRIKVDFPEQPERQDFGATKMYSLVTETYAVTATVNPFPPDVKEDGKPRVELYRRFIAGALHAATNGKVLSEKEIKIDDLEAREVVYTKDFNGASVTVTKRVVIVDNAFYVFEIWDLNGSGQKSVIDKFFKSIDVI